MIKFYDRANLLQLAAGIGLAATTDQICPVEFSVIRQFPQASNRSRPQITDHAQQSASATIVTRKYSAIATVLHAQKSGVLTRVTTALTGPRQVNFPLQCRPIRSSVSNALFCSIIGLTRSNKRNRFFETPVYRDQMRSKIVQQFAPCLRMHAPQTRAYKSIPILFAVSPHRVHLAIRL